MKREIIIAIAVGLIVGLLTGYIMGGLMAISWCVDKGMKFLELKNISIEVNEELLKDGIQRYRSNIDTWLK